MSTVGMDSHSWLGKEEAAQLLGVSSRQLERLTQAGQIEKKTLPRGPGEKTARAVYSRAAIEARKRGEPLALSAGSSGSAGSGGSDGATVALALAQTEQPARDGLLDLVAAHMARMLAAPEPKALPAPEPKALPAPAPKPWLTIDEAVNFSGLPKGYLLRNTATLAVNVGSEKQKRWRFSRSALAGE